MRSSGRYTREPKCSYHYRKGDMDNIPLLLIILGIIVALLVNGAVGAAMILIGVLLLIFG
jgi:hypothetical protein